jgi:hypothetical protein
MLAELVQMLRQERKAAVVVVQERWVELQQELRLVAVV